MEQWWYFNKACQPRAHPLFETAVKTESITRSLSETEVRTESCVKPLSETKGQSCVHTFVWNRSQDSHVYTLCLKLTSGQSCVHPLVWNRSQDSHVYTLCLKQTSGQSHVYIPLFETDVSIVMCTRSETKLRTVMCTHSETEVTTKSCVHPLIWNRNQNSHVYTLCLKQTSGQSHLYTPMSVGVSTE